MPASVMTMPEATKAVQMYEQGYSQPQIAQTLGRSRKAVRTAFRQLGVPTRPKKHQQLAPDVAALYRTGLSVREVAARLGVTPRTAGRALLAANEPLRRM